jgi:tetratricopeptide (TPR) repeat protein
MAGTIVRRTDKDAVTPFWQRIPRFFLFPLSRRPLLLMLGLAASLLLGWLVPRALVPIAFLATFVFLRFCYAVLDQAAFGMTGSAAGSGRGFGQYRPWKQLAVFVVYGLLVGLVHVLLGTVAGHIVEYGLLLLLPANVMWLGLTNSLAASLNVKRLVEVARAIGWPYLALCGFLMALSASADTASFFLWIGLSDTPLLFPAIALAQMYFTLIAFNMLGYAIYQYRDRFGLRAVTPAPGSAPAGTFNLAREVREVENAPATLDARIKRLLDAGQARAAVDLVQELVRLNPGERRYHERYHGVLRATHDSYALVRHAGPYIEVLLKAGEPGPALDLYRETRRTDAAFHLPEPHAQLALAQAAAAAGRDDVAVELIQDFDHAYPLADERAAAYLLGARLLNERFGAAGEARRLIEEMLEKFPHATQAEEARAYLAGLPR